MNTLNSQRPVVLVIDSDPILLVGTAAVLHAVGHESHCARDSQAALKAARSGRFKPAVKDGVKVKMWKTFSVPVKP